jgi:redox-sensitive bicupin YhaK (pirin superfamily)
MDDLAKHEDDFPIGWHPHRGFDIATYMKVGRGRHGDSLGHREVYESPGMQWMSTGSGVYHAEGGANKKGERMQGFQIWINVPSEKKLDEPRYGTVQLKDLPVVKVSEHCGARVLAGDFLGVKGPFTTVQPVQMIDFELASSSSSTESGEESLSPPESVVVRFDISDELDTAMIFVYEGALQNLNEHHGDEEIIPMGSIVLLDASDTEKRSIVLTSLPGKAASVMLFAGKWLNQPIAWQGPIVMTDEYEIANSMSEIRGGFFPPVCVGWDYRRLSSKPADDDDADDDA